MPVMWRKYETYIAEQLRAYYPSSRVQVSQKVKGRFSKTSRQIDISIRTKIEGFEMLGVVECKYYARKIDVKIVESILGFMEDVGADFGYIITNQGFSKSARRRTERQRLLLRVIKFTELDKALFTLDEIIDKKIQLLDCLSPVFLIRQQQRSTFVNMDATSYDARVLEFKEDFVVTPHFAHKKLLKETARVFRDFPCIERIRIVIPVATEQRMYSSEIGIAEFQQFLQVSFSDLQRNIKLWRGFLGTVRKPLVQKFAAEYVRTELYSTEHR